MIQSNMSRAQTPQGGGPATRQQHTLQKSGSNTLVKSGSSTANKDKNESFLDRISTIGRKKKMEEAEGIEIEGMHAIDLPGIQVPVELMPDECQLEEGEERSMIAPESRQDQRIKDIIGLLMHWINDELADQRIIVKDILEDLYDGLVIQNLIEKLTGLNIEYPEVSQSEYGQLERLRIVLDVANQILAKPRQWDEPKWTPESIHNKELVAILHLLIALALHFRAPIRFPEYANAQVIIVQKRDGELRTRYVTEQLTTEQTDLGLPGEKDAFDTLFGHGPDTLEKVKRSLISFANKYLNRINLEVSDLETNFQDGVNLILLMGLLEGYFVPFYAFHLQVTSFEHKVHNVNFAFQLMQEAGLPKPRARPEDIVNGDLKCTMRVIHMLFIKYKYAE